MNGTETHTLELKKGDTLKILFETVDVYGVKIISPDGTALYQEDGTVKQFTVEAFTRETTDTSVSIAPPVQEHNNQDAVTADNLVGPWHLMEDEKDNATAMEASPALWSSEAAWRSQAMAISHGISERRAEPVHIR